jgi:hypothetical protein
VSNYDTVRSVKAVEASKVFSASFIAKVVTIVEVLLYLEVFFEDVLKWLRHGVFRLSLAQTIL